MHAITMQAEQRRIRVWDPVVRLFHWTIVAGFVANMWLIEDGGNAHEIVGYVVLAAIAIRLVWGVVGSQYARFSQFVPGPSRLWRYLRCLAHGSEPRHVGHNPAGAIMMVALIALMLAVGVSGWMMTLDMYWGEEWLEDLHEALAEAILPLAGLHVLGAVIESFRHRENLIWSMISGRKRAPDGSDVTGPRDAPDPGRG